MPAPNSEDGLRAGYVKVMGPELGNLCHELQNDFAWLQRKWMEFGELFQRGQDRIDLLNSTASNFFYFLNKLLYEDALLHIARITDPAESFGRQNLSVTRLAGAIAELGLRQSVEAATARALTTCEFARAWRNKRLAHADLDTLRQGNAAGLPEVTEARVEDALESLRQLLRMVDEHYGMVPFLSLRDPWGARSLVHFLEKGRRAVSSS